MLPEILSAFGDTVLAHKEDRGEVTIEVEPERILEVCRRLKQELQFVRLADQTAVDRYPLEPRFEIVYHLHSLARNQRLRVKARLTGANPEIDSIIPVWRSADWHEREIYDLFGVTFRHHPNLCRIMLPEDWEGYPLRKDYPITGPRV